jgi:hypothetical protein
MKVKLLLTVMFSFRYAFAGTPGNSDVSVLYGIAMVILGLMAGCDYLIRFIRKKKKLMEMDAIVNNHDSIDSGNHLKSDVASDHEANYLNNKISNE